MAQIDSAQRVLVVGISEAQTRDLAALLANRGLAADIARSVQQALIEAPARLPDLIVLDSSLPQADRLNLLRQLRRAERTADVPIIWIGEGNDPRSLTTALETGANEALARPFGPPELLWRVELLVARASVRRHTEIEASLLARLVKIEEALSRTEAKRADLSERIARCSQPLIGTRSADKIAGGPRPGVERPPLVLRELAQRTAELNVLDASMVKEVDELVARYAQRPMVLSVLVMEPDRLADLLMEAAVADPDPILRQLEELVRTSLLEEHVLQRVGSSRLCVLLPDQGERRAVELARRLCHQVVRSAFPIPGHAAPLTLSIGISTIDRETDSSPFDLIDWGLEALTKAQRLGGNRWWVHHH